MKSTYSCRGCSSASRMEVLKSLWEAEMNSGQKWDFYIKIEVPGSRDF